jgi:UDP-N-acetylglucosamine 2-epimerase (non-hydrolysing)
LIWKDQTILQERIYGFCKTINEYMSKIVNKDIILNNISKANINSVPLFIIVLATKPCYIKLYSVIKEFEHSKLPHIVIETGQHYSSELINHKFEFDYSNKISIIFQCNDDLISKSISVVKNITFLSAFLKSNKLIQKAIPIVSGDTISAALFAQNWYLKNKIRSIHIEAGLRSFAPNYKINYDSINDIRKQQTNKWIIDRDNPFPETECSKIASQFSDILFAPVKLNSKNLIAEGYKKSNIVISGSLSADAIQQALILLENKTNSIFDRIPYLKKKKWIRIDLHRRENMTISSIEKILSSIEWYTSSKDCNIILVVSNLFSKYYSIDSLQGRFKTQIEKNKVVITKIWDNYLDVIEFFNSKNCLGVITDSGGLQEELLLLNKPCFVYRNSTDRLEAIIESNNNLLLSPFTEENVKSALVVLKNNFFYNNSSTNFHHSNFYGSSVSKKIISSIKIYYNI